MDDLSDDTDRDRDPSTHSLKTGFGYGAGFVSLVLVALFVQKSDGNSTLGTIGLLAVASAGAMLLTACCMGVAVRARRATPVGCLTWLLSRRTSIVLTAASGVVLLTVASVGIDAGPSDFAQEPTEPAKQEATCNERADEAHGEQEATNDAGTKVHDAASIALRGLTIAADETGGRRAGLTIVNKTESPIVLDSMCISFSSTIACAAPLPPEEGIFKITDEITVHGERIMGGGLIRDGFTVPITGRYYSECPGRQVVTISAPVSIGLAPLETMSLGVDFPAILRIRDISDLSTLTFAHGSLSIMLGYGTDSDEQASIWE